MGPDTKLAIFAGRDSVCASTAAWNCFGLTSGMNSGTGSGMSSGTGSGLSFGGRFWCKIGGGIWLHSKGCHKVKVRYELGHSFDFDNWLGGNARGRFSHRFRCCSGVSFPVLLLPQAPPLIA